MGPACALPDHPILGLWGYGGRGPLASCPCVQEMSSEYREYADSFGKVSPAGCEAALEIDSHHQRSPASHCRLPTGKGSPRASLSALLPLLPSAGQVLTTRLGQLVDSGREDRQEVASPSSHFLEEEQELPTYRWHLTKWPGPLSLCSPLTRHLPGTHFPQKSPPR